MSIFVPESPAAVGHQLFEQDVSQGNPLRRRREVLKSPLIHCLRRVQETVLTPASVVEGADCRAPGVSDPIPTQFDHDPTGDFLCVQETSKL